jgi:hypothetical protein
MPAADAGRSRCGPRLVASLIVVLGAVCAGEATAAPPAAGLRLWLGPAVALDPIFAAGAAGVDWFLSPRAGLGLTVSGTVSGTGDRAAVEQGYAFADVVARLREAAAGGQSLHAELLAGAGLARTRFRSPGAHVEVAPDLLLGAALALALPSRLELALELAVHVTLGPETATRNRAHTSELLCAALRWGGP